jgi:hypothetical protein
MADCEVRTDGFEMRRGPWQCTASLRYFTAAGAFVDGLSTVLGGALPGPLQAVRRGVGGAVQETSGSPGTVLCWRSPTETLLLTDTARLAAVDAFAQAREDLCVVDQTGGIRPWTLCGVRVADVLLRAGSPALIPDSGASRVGRMAELTLLTACVEAAEVLLLVERVYEPHLLEWIRETVADL